MMARCSGALSVASAATFGLLFLMQLLITMQQQEMRPGPEVMFPEIMRVPKDQPVEVTRPKPKPPAPVEVEPLQPELQFGDPEVTPVPVTLGPRLAVEGATKYIGTGISDGDIMVLSKVRPLYPDKAARLGLEGHVIVQFTVTAKGTVERVIVLESSHRVFERPSIQAAKKFRYKPRYVNGQAVAVDGVKNRFTFEIQPN